MRDIHPRELLRELPPSAMLDAAADEEFVERVIADLDPDLLENNPYYDMQMAVDPDEHFESKVIWRWEPVPPKPKESGWLVAVAAVALVFIGFGFGCFIYVVTR